MGKQTERQNQMETQINNPVNVTIFHRNNEQFGDCWKLTKEFNSDYADYTPSWKEVYTYQVENTSMNAVDSPHEDCFEINNRVDGTDKEMPVKFQTRSLSVGDVVVIWDPRNEHPLSGKNSISEFHFVDSFGWVRLYEKDFVQTSVNEMTMAEGRN
mgnify:CR=1 FL=1